MKSVFLLALALLSSAPEVVQSARHKLQTNLEEPSPVTEKNFEGLNRYLRNGVTLPLVGLGLGNLEHDRIIAIINDALGTERNLNYQLIDTGKASENERMIAETINDVLSPKNLRSFNTTKTEIHIVTKVWYTHLGYERTKLSVKESIKDLTEPLQDNPHVDLRIHFLLHWPRCYPEISWMNCEEEEEALPQYVKDAGPPPHQKEDAWRDSWRALEDMYLERDSAIASIGVSNFDQDDLTALLEDCKVQPHIFQGRLETVHTLWDLLWDTDIAIQMYHVFQTLTLDTDHSMVLNARRQLMDTAGSMSTEDNIVAPASLMIAHLARAGVGTITRTSFIDHLIENSPTRVLDVPELTMEQTVRMRFVIDSLLDAGDYDVDGTNVPITFYNGIPDSNVEVFWIDHKTEERAPVTGQIRPGDAVTIQAHPGHRFIAHNVHDGKEVRQFNVGVNYGESQWFSVEL